MLRHYCHASYVPTVSSYEVISHNNLHCWHTFVYQTLSVKISSYPIIKAYILSLQPKYKVSHYVRCYIIVLVPNNMLFCCCCWRTLHWLAYIWWNRLIYLFLKIISLYHNKWTFTFWRYLGSRFTPFSLLRAHIWRTQGNMWGSVDPTWLYAY